MQNTSSDTLLHEEGGTYRIFQEEIVKDVRKIFRFYLYFNIGKLVFLDSSGCIGNVCCFN